MDDEFNVDFDHLGIMCFSQSFEERVLERDIVLGNVKTQGIDFE